MPRLRRPPVGRLPRSSAGSWPLAAVEPARTGTRLSACAMLQVGHAPGGAPRRPADGDVAHSGVGMTSWNLLVRTGTGALAPGATTEEGALMADFSDAERAY